MSVIFPKPFAANPHSGNLWYLFLQSSSAQDQAAGSLIGSKMVVYTFDYATQLNGTS
jgi:hypothetical protein